MNISPPSTEIIDLVTPERSTTTTTTFSSPCPFPDLESLLGGTTNLTTAVTAVNGRGFKDKLCAAASITEEDSNFDSIIDLTNAFLPPLLPLHRVVPATRPACEVGLEEGVERKRRQKENSVTVQKKELQRLNRLGRHKNNVLSELTLCISPLWKQYEGFWSALTPAALNIMEMPRTTLLEPHCYWLRLVEKRYSPGKDLFVPCECRREVERFVVIWQDVGDFFRDHLLPDPMSSLGTSSLGPSLGSPIGAKMQQRLEKIRQVYPDQRQIWMFEGMESFLMTRKKAHNLNERRLKRQNSTASITSITSTTSTTSITSRDITSTVAGGEEELLEEAFLMMQMQWNCLIVLTKDAWDSAAWISRLTAQLALTPYRGVRRNHQKLRKTFSLPSSRSTTTPSNNQEARQTWAQMLGQIRNLNSCAISAITREYPTLRSIQEAWKSNELLLQDVMVFLPLLFPHTK